MVKDNITKSAKKLLKQKNKYKNYNDCGYTEEQQQLIKKYIANYSKKNYTKEERQQMIQMVASKLNGI
jgi:hypothetical protein